MSSILKTLTGEDLRAIVDMALVDGVREGIPRVDVIVGMPVDMVLELAELLEELEAIMSQEGVDLEEALTNWNPGSDQAQ